MTVGGPESRVEERALGWRTIFSNSLSSTDWNSSSAVCCMRWI